MDRPSLYALVLQQLANLDVRTARLTPPHAGNPRDIDFIATERDRALIRHQLPARLNKKDCVTRTIKKPWAEWMIVGFPSSDPLWSVELDFFSSLTFATEPLLKAEGLDFASDNSIAAAAILKRSLLPALSQGFTDHHMAERIHDWPQIDFSQFNQVTCTAKNELLFEVYLNILKSDHTANQKLLQELRTWFRRRAARDVLLLRPSAFKYIRSQVHESTPPALPRSRLRAGALDAHSLVYLRDNHVFNLTPQGRRLVRHNFTFNVPPELYSQCPKQKSGQPELTPPQAGQNFVRGFFNLPKRQS